MSSLCNLLLKRLNIIENDAPSFVPSSKRVQAYRIFTPPHTGATTKHPQIPKE